MKRYLLWKFDRGSFQWDILCVLILAFLFLIPRDTFSDVPGFMKVYPGEAVRETSDRNGNKIFTVQLKEPCFFDTYNTREKTIEMLEETLGKPVRQSRDQPRIQPIRSRTGLLIAYAIWKER